MRTLIKLLGITVVCMVAFSIPALLALAIIFNWGWVIGAIICFGFGSEIYWLFSYLWDKYGINE